MDNKADAKKPITCELSVPCFMPETIASIGKGYGLSIADIDGDGKQDILLADVWDFVWFRNGDWKRFVLASRLDGQGAMSIDGHDVTGDGLAEIAVCTRGPASGVYFLRRPDDPTQLWDPVRLPAEPEQHRIQWARDYTGSNYLIAVPNLGRRNHLRFPGLTRDDVVKVYAYSFTPDPGEDYHGILLLESMRDMHAFAVVPTSPVGPERLIFIGMEGVELMNGSAGKSWSASGTHMLTGMTPPNQRPDKSWHSGLGEIDEGHISELTFLATIEPKHGTDLVLYPADTTGEFGDIRMVLDSTLVNAHSLQCLDLLDLGYDQIIAGWWGSAPEKKDYGIRLYIPLDPQGIRWQTVPVDEGTISCQNLQIADLNNDGRPDLIAAGWSTNNLMIFWNNTILHDEAGLIGHWDFNEQSGQLLMDQSGNNNHGHIYGTPQRVTGISGGSLWFTTNDDYVEFDTPLIPPQDFTISLWINCYDTEKQFFLGQYLYAHPHRLDLAVREGSVRIQIDSIIDSPKLIQPHHWYHLTYTRSGTDLRIYLNGKLVTQANLPTPVIQTQNLILGKIFVPNQDAFRFTGMLDEMKIWNGALPASAIRKEYKSLSH